MREVFGVMNYLLITLKKINQLSNFKRKLMLSSEIKNSYPEPYKAFTENTEFQFFIFDGYKGL